MINKKRRKEIVKIANVTRKLLNIPSNLIIDDVTIQIAIPLNIKVVWEEYPDKYKDMDGFVYINPNNTKHLYTIGVNPTTINNLNEFKYRLLYLIGHILLNHFGHIKNEQQPKVTRLYTELNIKGHSFKHQFEEESHIFAIQLLTPYK